MSATNLTGASLTRLGGVAVLHSYPINFDTAGIGTGVLIDTFYATTTNPIQIEVSCQIVTAFNAGTSNVLTVGTTAALANQWLGSSDITEGTPGYYPASNAVAKFRLTDITQVYAKYNGNFATGTLTSNNTNVSNDVTVTIGSTVYTFKTTLGTTTGNVLIGADADASLLNLIRAINFSGTPGTDYVGSAANSQVSAATSVTSHAFAVTALTSGTGANSIATTETAAGAILAWGASTLTGGTTATTGAAKFLIREAQENTAGVV